VDIRNPLGAPVFTVLPGRIVAIGSSAGAGNYIKVDHGNGYETSYSHTRAVVSVGEKVTRGQTIGHSDGSGIGSAPHLHFVLRIDGVRVDPQTYILDKVR